MTRFAASQYDFHLWADDYKKCGTLLSSGSGRDQTKADYHIIRKQLGIITNVAGMVGDNAQTRTGHKSKTPFCLIKSYSLCGVTFCQRSKGDMDNAHICQLHHKIAWSIMEGQISTNQYMLSLKSWIKSPTSSNVGPDTLGVPPSTS